MAPPKLGYPNWVARKTQSNARTTHDLEVDGANKNQLEGFMDVDVISYLVIEPVSLTIIEEQDQQNLTTKEMEIDPWSELQNHSTEKNHMQRTRLGEAQP